MTSRPLEPTTIATRIDAIDVARGFALLGILVVNVQTFGGPFPWAAPDPYDHGVDRAVYAITDALFASKFFPLFGLLFGLSARLQLDRLEGAGVTAGRFYVRRMAALLAIGLVHAALLSTIDILVQYALLGLLVPTLARRSDRVLVGLAIACLTVPALVTTAIAASGRSRELFGHLPDSHELIAAYGGRDFGAFVRQRFGDLRGYYLWVLTYSGWVMAAMTALGLTSHARALALTHAGSVGAPGTDGPEPTLARLRNVGFAIGLPLATLHAALFLHYKSHGLTDPRLFVVSSFAAALEEPALAIAYAATIGLWATSSRTSVHSLAHRVREGLAAIGRLSLTSYVMQSVVMNLVFFGFGLGLYGRVRPLHLLGFVVITYVGQIGLARFVLARTRQGPLEALWRRLTYSPTLVVGAPNAPSSTVSGADTEDARGRRG